jgi:hypothetical protein
VVPFTEEALKKVPESEGVFQLLNADHQVMVISGTINLRRDLLDLLEANENATFFSYEEDKMYSRRESELIQKYLQLHGRMPGGGNDEDDLF